MPRPKQCRRVECPPNTKGFRPFGIGCCRNREVVTLQIDEYETIRLIDLEGLTQEDAAKKMQISRPTLTRIYDQARRAIAEAIVGNKILQIGEGDVEYYGQWHSNIITNNKEEVMKKIAIPTNNGILFQHFGKASQFTFVTIEDGKVTSKEAVDAPPHAHGVAPRFILSHKATEVIAGGIGASPVNMLMEAGVDVHIGAPSLQIDEIIAKYLDGSLTFDENNVCAGHNHEHGREGRHHEDGIGHHHGEGEGKCGGHDGHHHCGNHGDKTYTIPSEK